MTEYDRFANSHSNDKILWATHENSIQIKNKTKKYTMTYDKYSVSNY